MLAFRFANQGALSDFLFLPEASAPHIGSLGGGGGGGGAGAAASVFDIGHAPPSGTPAAGAESTDMLASIGSRGIVSSSSSALVLSGSGATGVGSQRPLRVVLAGMNSALSVYCFDGNTHFQDFDKLAGYVKDTVSSMFSKSVMSLYSAVSSIASATTVSSSSTGAGAVQKEEDLGLARTQQLAKTLTSRLDFIDAKRRVQRVSIDPSGKVKCSNYSDSFLLSLLLIFGANCCSILRWHVVHMYHLVASPRISLHLLASHYISSHLITSPRISLHLLASDCIAADCGGRQSGTRDAI